MQFLNLLEKRFGKRIHQFTDKIDNHLYFYPERINNDNTIIDQKCISCPAHIYRQDFPFWIGSHINKKLMVIAQDAGKGFEDFGINTVFSIHVAGINLETYFNASSRHKRYFELFKGMFDKEDFLHEIYFTDIVKCAFSTENKIKLDEVNCKDDVFIEIEEVNPKAIVLMGTAAQSVFLSLVNKNNLKLEFINKSECAINERSSVKFLHYKLENKSVFFIPHLVGNLHVSKNRKEELNNFSTYVQQQIKLIVHS
jgi:uracil-DNA glycosylase